ncbi:MAG: glutamate--cysteine ligase [Deltaproteobacteria bacterium]|nr:glutamate--cysteine ligase [Deltaproteobacteria bacterium]
MVKPVSDKERRLERSDLRNSFERAMKPSSSWQVGVEIEKLGVFDPTGKALPYSGPISVDRVHQSLIDHFGWKPMHEKDHVLALYRECSSITLEPGAQHELSTCPYPNLHGCLQEFRRHLQELVPISSALGIRWLSLGMQPVSSLQEIEWIPKRRYQIMSERFKKTGALGPVMMKQTAGIQTSLDYSDERDACEKFRVGMALSPIVTAISANSPVAEGKPNGYLSFRAQAWLDTDPARCGLLREAFSNSFNLDDYIGYALKMPMIFIQRKGDWIPMDPIPFEQFLEKGYQGHTPVYADWELHLSTLFLEVRFHPYLELRSSDSPSPELLFSIPALWKGILYSASAMKQAWDLVKDGSWEERMAAYRAVPKEGLKTKFRGKPILQIAKDLLQIAKRGLEEQREEEAPFLEPLMELITQEERSPAERILEKWHGPWQQRIEPLLDDVDFFKLIRKSS